MKLYPFLFKPNFHKTVWGGNQLKPYKGFEPTDETIGESWEVSALPISTSIISNGILEGKDLITVIKEQPDAILGKKVNKKYNGKLPLLVKFIDARWNLSVQVHPNDSFARREHGKMGKSEMWYVIRANDGSHLYAGFKYEITPKEFQQRVVDGTIIDVLTEYQVKPGDVFYLPAGRIHAICGGIMLAEIQQSSDVTYRIYDYNRLDIDGKPRKLNTELAAAAIDYHVEQDYRTEYNVILNNEIRIVDTPYFNVQLLELTEPYHRNLLKYDSFIIMMCIEGDCKVVVRNTGSEILLREGNCTLIPASIAEYDILPQDGKTRILDAFIDN